MFSLPILVLFLDIAPLIQASLPQNEAESFYGLADVAANLVTVDNTDAVIISDFELKQQTDFVGDLGKMGIKYRMLDMAGLERLKDSRPEEPCPFFIQPHARRRRRKRATEGQAEMDHHDEGHHGEDHHGMSDQYFFPRDELYQRSPFIPLLDYYPSYFIWMKNYTRLFSIFDSTILQCKQKVDVGIYDPGARFYFIIHHGENPESVFEFNDYLHRHPQVGILQKVDTLDSERIMYKIYGYNFFHQVNGLGNVVLNHLWTPESKISKPKEAFTDIMDMQGLELRIATNPWSHHVLADAIPESDPDYSESNKYRNYWGYEIEMLYNMANVLNFTYDIKNPPDGKWGHIEPDGRWNGLVYHVSQDSADLVICDVFIVYGRQSVFDGTIPFDVDYLVFSAPQPELLPKYLALVYPLQLEVWICVVVSVLVFSILFYVIARVEGHIMSWTFHEWHTLSKAAWYTYGTLLGEAITRDTKSGKSKALRIAIATWILYCLIISQGYGGSLKAYLSTPAFSNPIDTLQQVIESKLPWGMVLYGEEEEEMMANSQDPIIQTIWNEKIVAPYNAVPQIRPVYDGEKVFIDWKSGLEPAIFVRYSTPAGDPLIHVASNPVFMPNYPGWAFYKFNPWRKRFDQVLRRMLEAGLVEHYKFEVWQRMRKEYLESDEEKLVHEEKNFASALSLDDLQGVFYLSGLLICLGIVVFLFELIISGAFSRNDPTFNGDAAKIIQVKQHKQH